MKKITFLLAILLIATVSFAEIKVETFEGAHNVDLSGSSTYLTTPTQSFAASSATGLKWTTLLGSVRTGLGNFSTTAAVIRAMKSTETAIGYGYLVSDSIVGGIDSLWFDWNSNGAESGNWDIRVLVNNVEVGTINQAAGLQKTATEITEGNAYKFNIGGLDKSGKFVLKIENRTPYTGTSNKFRFVLDNLSWTSYVAPGEKQDPSLVYATQKITKLLSADNFTNALTNNSDGVVTYTSSNNSCATVNSTTGEVDILDLGTTTITASVAESANFNAASVSYVITVKPDNWKMESFTNISNVCIVNPAATSCSQTPVTDIMDNNVSWTYWLGGGNTQLFGNNAMYLRARLSTETAYDYGYVKSDSISGGLSTLSFQWNQGGSETGYNYNVEVTVNGNVVGAITDAGEGAAFTTPKTFSVNNLTYDEKFVVKIENKSIYDGTSNKVRIVIDNIEWTGYEASPTTGISQTQNKNIAVYPNNITDVINIQTAEKEFTVSIYNQLGSLIIENQNIRSIPVSQLASGLYIVKVQTAGGETFRTGCFDDPVPSGNMSEGTESKNT